MPLTEQQQQALEALKGADPREVADALKATSSDHYQAIFRVGFGTAKGEYENAEKTGKLDLIQGQLALARDQADQIQAELKTLREKTPDFEAERQRYEDRLKAKDKEAKEAKEAADVRVKTTFKKVFQANLKAELIALGVEPDYAGEVLIHKYDTRIQPGEDGSIKVLDDDGLTPLQATDGQLARVFAEKVKASVDPKWIISNADKGGGTSGQTAAGGASKAWDELREQARARHTPAKDADAIKERRMKLLPH